MKKNPIYLILIVVFATMFFSLMLLNQEEHQKRDEHAADEHGVEDEIEKGPNRGRMLREDKFALEITIFESGVPPQFRVYSYYEDKLLPPQNVELEINLTRLDGSVDQHKFIPGNDFLEGDNIVTEPHSFDVTVTAKYNSQSYQWAYDNYEGRVDILPEMADVNGIKTELAGPAKIRETLTLSGRVQLDPNRLSHSRARFPGVIKSVSRDLGDAVKKGDVLAVVQSNESLQDYRVTSAINGVIVMRDVQPGEITGESPLFTIADVSTLWVELDVFNKDLDRVKRGQSVLLETLNGTTTEGKIDWLSPMAAHASQSVQARIVLANKNDNFRPGQFVRGKVTIGEYSAKLAVKQSAIQSFRDFQVVYAKAGNTYEVRMLELGHSDSEWIEVVSGLKPATEYVTENSYLIKADIEKSGASHDH